MAELNIQFPVDLRKNNNEESKYYGKLYAVSAKRKTLNTLGLAKHIAEHGSMCTLEVIMLVLNQLQTCIPELLSQGVSVELEGLGTFVPSVKCNTPCLTVEDALEKGIDTVVNGVKMNFLPNNTDLLGLTAKKLKARCSLAWNDVVEITTTTIDGKKKRIQTRTPISQWADKQAAGITVNSGEPMVNP